MKPLNVLWSCTCTAVLAGCGSAIGSDSRLADRQIGDAAHGRRLIEHYSCGACHAIPGIHAPGGRIGPPLRDLSERAYIAGRLPNTPSNLVAWLSDPPAIDPATAMPALGLKQEDARDIAAYLYAIR